jgi:Zn finger protein HypA/HybF involved in hydrogenase expression
VGILRGSETLNKAERSMSIPHYRLRCRGCEEMLEDDGFVLECPTHHDEPALLVQISEVVARHTNLIGRGQQRDLQEREIKPPCRAFEPVGGV